MSSRSALVAELLETLRRANALTVSLTQAAAAQLGINTTDLHCMNLLGQGDPKTAGELARLTGLTTASITGVIDRLEKAGYARRRPDPSDRRRVVVELVMDRAAPAVAPVFTPLVRAMRQTLDDYSEEQLQLIADFLERAEAVFRADLNRMRAPKS